MTLWQEFISLEVTSPTLVPTLKALLRSHDDLKAIYQLTGPEAQGVVDSLNRVCNISLIVRILTVVRSTSPQAIDSPQLTESLQKGTLHVLCKLCGLCQLLPTGYVLGDGLIETKLRIGSGGFADVCQGTYGEMRVAIKRLRVDEGDDFTKIYKVSSLILREC